MFARLTISDKETHKAMQEIYENFSYVADPHGAIGYLGLQKYFENNADYYGVFLETVHPVKFLDVVEKAIKRRSISLHKSKKY